MLFATTAVASAGGSPSLWAELLQTFAQLLDHLAQYSDQLWEELTQNSAQLRDELAHNSAQTLRTLTDLSCDVKALH